MFFLLLLHRPYLFHIPQSRKELLTCGISILDAQEIFFQTLKPNQHVMFTLTYLTIEPCVSVLAVLISHPHENHELIINTLNTTKLATERLQKIRHTNPLAGPGLRVIKAILSRAEEAVTRAKAQLNSQPSFPASTSRSPLLPHQPSITSSVGNGENLQQDLAYTHLGDQPAKDSTDALDMLFNDTAIFPVSSQPLLPMADLLHYDFASGPMENLITTSLLENEDVDNTGPRNRQSQFAGTPDDQMLWDTVNYI
ncbi:hypothetical protein F5884DRAFT_798566 [Xylogone sp. PMI_703]|nr:hypothetical protein F5884DRAFT_798566 [Xylogone sp. PMI_703]